MADAKKRSFADLRVIDLRCELEKRSLDKTGVRAVLLRRLLKAVKDEGNNPDTFTFDVSGNDQKSPNKKVSRSDSVVENDEPPIDVNVDELLVQDEINDEDESAEKIEDENEPEAKPEEESNGNDKKVSRKRENDEKVQTVAPKKACVEKAPAQESPKKQADLINADAEDSINLDIGDDELLNDETDSTSRAKKDEGATPQPTQQEPPTTDGDAMQPGADAAPPSDRPVDETPADAKKTSEPDETGEDKEKKDDKGDNDTSEGKNAEGNAGSNATSSSNSGQARNLWVSGLSGDTRAKDLKQLCSKHGKVIGAKVVTNARTPGSRCYGYVTMASAQDAESCIKNLHRTELHGRMISVEKAKSESSASASAGGAPRDSSSWRRSGATQRSYRRTGGDHRRSASGGGAAEGKENKDEKAASKEEGAAETAVEEGAEGADKDKEKGEAEGGADGAAREGEEHKPDDKRKHSTDRASRTADKHADKPRRERSRGRRTSPRDVLSFSKIWKERDTARSRERMRAVREEERRRRNAEEDLRERERRQRSEKHKLAQEREKLRQEREKIEREKNELLRLERERHKLEREKLELERLELKRAQIRLEEERSRGLKRSYEPAYERSARPERKAVSPPAYDRHKRTVPSAAAPVSTSSSRQFEPPPPPRFELPTPAYERPSADKRERDYKRDYTRHISSSANVKYPSNGTANDDSRQPLPPGTRPKEQQSRYVESERSSVRAEAARASAGREGRGYRGASPGKGESARSWGAAAPRYADAPAQGKGEYAERSSWHSNSKYSSSRHPAPSGAPPVSAHQTWGKPGGESWTSSSAGEARYGGGGAAAGATYDSRYAAPYQPPPPGAAPYVADTRYAPPASAREYRKY